MIEKKTPPIVLMQAATGAGMSCVISYTSSTANQVSEHVAYVIRQRSYFKK